MTRYLIDSNIVSELAKPLRSPALVDWMGRQVDEELFIATMTVGEIWRGILQLRSGRRRLELETWFAGPEGPSALFQGRILPFDVAASMEWARIMAEGTLAARPRGGIDMIIAATAVANDCVVVTANERHFAGVVEFLNPLRDAS